MAFPHLDDLTYRLTTTLSSGYACGIAHRTNLLYIIATNQTQETYASLNGTLTAIYGACYNSSGLTMDPVPIVVEGDCNNARER